MRVKRRDEDGAAAVEFALIMIPFVILLMGIIEFAFYFWTAESTNSSARETTRKLVVGDCWTGYDAFAKNHAPRIMSTRLEDASGAAIASPASLAVGDKLVLKVTANSAIINFFPFIPDTVTRTYEARMEDDTNSGACG